MPLTHGRALLAAVLLFGAATGGRALIVTDGYSQFETAHAAATSLVSSDAVEQMLIISVGVPVSQGEEASGRRRVYEFSAPGWPMTDPFGKAVTSFCAAMHSPAGRCSVWRRRGLP